MTVNVLLFGAPGSGKGSISQLLVKDFAFVHISAGDLLRVEVERKTPMGRKIGRMMEEGQLIPDPIIIDIVFERMNQPDAREHGVILDGFPRTLQQAQALATAGIRFDVMAFLNVSEATLLERCVLRRLDPETGRIYNLKTDPPPKEVEHRLLVRSDDTPEKHQKRMVVYHRQKADLMAHYEDITLELDGNPPLAEVYPKLKRAIELLRDKSRETRHASKL